MALSLRQLEIFERIATTGSVTRAGDELLLTQSAVSMALSQLEQLSATPLFERSGRRLILNDSGRLLLKKAREILLAVKRDAMDKAGISYAIALGFGHTEAIKVVDGSKQDRTGSSGEELAYWPGIGSPCVGFKP